MKKEKLLIIDDEVENLSLLRARLESCDFDVITTVNPRDGIEYAKTEKPDLILLDVNMPEMDGYTVCRALKGGLVTSHIPVVLLTCMDSLDHKLMGLEGGADDYLVKDKIDYREIAARIRSHLRRTKVNISANPLTKLPGNPAIEQRFNELIENGESFALGYLDIDNFKAYNDYYGFTQGDKIIQFVAQSLVSIVNKAGMEGDFVGHIGGDDFIFLSHIENAGTIASATVQWIKKAAPELYTREDRQRGGILGKDRDGNTKLFGFIGVSIAIVFSDKNLKTFSEYSSLAAKIKKALKNSGGSGFADRSILSE